MDPDTEMYRQALSEGATWARNWTRVLGWLVVAVVCGLGALWAAALYRGRATDRSNRLLAILNALPVPRGLIRWLATRRLTATVAAGFGLAFGVYLGVLQVDGGWLRRHGRFRCRTPHQVGRALTAWAGRVHDS